MTQTLNVHNLDFTYEGASLPTLRNISFSLSAGECVLLTGSSGCGKSTLLHCINGLIPAYYPGTLSGNIQLMGNDISNRPLWDIADDIGTVFQNPDTQFFQSNVEDELAFGLEHRKLSAENIRKKLDSVKDYFELSTLFSRDLFSLSSGEKQRIAIAAITALEQPILLFDEPTANLDPDAVRSVIKMLKKLKKQGRTLLIAEHRIAHIAEIADRAVVMNDGEIIYDGATNRLNDAEFRQSAGLRVNNLAQVTNESVKLEESGQTVLEVSALTWKVDKKTKLIDNISFKIKAGECVGLIGANGAGKSTLARVIAGLEKKASGTVTLNGETLSPKQRIGQVGYVSQHADQQLFADTVSEEISMGLSGITKSEKLKAILKRFDLSKLAERHPHSLSGGEKQRTAIAAAIALSPDVLILDEPTSGMDGLHLRQLATEIQRLYEDGISVMVITHDYELIAMVCNRLIRMEGGQKLFEKGKDKLIDELIWFNG